ncbi:MAG: methylated-DNA--[protein]-cysteine S-methyltransferase, partial [Proteobacteria bacterium]|nr:methylated-DNA--[protein]-cysteine S-methyltransferase [Pseudomonadota bacterium]
LFLGTQTNAEKTDYLFPYVVKFGNLGKSPFPLDKIHRMIKLVRMLNYSIFKTIWGWMGVVTGEKGVKKVILPHLRYQDVEQSILREFPNVLADDSSLKPLAKIFARYFRGGEIPPNLALDWSGCSEFCRMVLTATQSIPRGKVKSYSWISLQIKIPRSFRAVGNALRKNPLPLLIPCHRVIRSNGTLGGFSAPAGVDLKRKLLKMEGVRFDKKGEVSLSLLNKV